MNDEKEFPRRFFVSIVDFLSIVKLNLFETFGKAKKRSLSSV
jgi:hypothetical protein